MSTTDTPRLTVNDQGPRVVLAHRLRALREERWPGMKVTQAQLAAALSGNGRRSASVPLISSWESRNPRLPPSSRIEDIATFFASPRSFDGKVGHLLSLDEMTAQEQAARETLLRELTLLRGEALGASRAPTADTPDTGDDFEAFRIGPWRFPDGKRITIVCAQLPHELLERMPYTEPDNPDILELYEYADLDSLLELFGHLRAANPANRLNYRTTHRLQSDDYAAHLVSLDGIDWHRATDSLLNQLQLPLPSVTDCTSTEDAHFKVEDNGRILCTAASNIVIFFAQSSAADVSPEWVAQRLAFLLLIDLVRLQQRLAAELIRPLCSLKPIASSRQVSTRDQMIGSGRPLRGPTSARVSCPTRGMATAA